MPICEAETRSASHGRLVRMKELVRTQVEPRGPHCSAVFGVSGPFHQPSLCCQQDILGGDPRVKALTPGPEVAKLTRVQVGQHQGVGAGVGVRESLILGFLKPGGPGRMEVPYS